MKRLLVIAILLLLSTPLLASSWHVQKWAPSLAKMTIGEASFCTTFSINEEQALYMTALHCLSPDSVMKIDDDEVQVVDQDSNSLTMVVRGSSGRPALLLGRKPKQGDEVASFGWGLRSPFPLVQAGLIQAVEGDSFGDGDKVASIGVFLIPGMSGGPILNRADQVIGVNQFAGQPDSYMQSQAGSSSYDSLKHFWRRYGN